MIVLDNSILVHGLTGDRTLYAAMVRAIEQAEPLTVPALVLYEWLRGPRLAYELEDVYRLIRPEAILPFGPQEAQVAAELYLCVDRPRSRAFDLAIAACAIVRGAPLWTTNPRDFADIPSLRLYRPA